MLKYFLTRYVWLVLPFIFWGCGRNSDEEVVHKPLVVFAQANSQDPWRRAFDVQMRSEFKKVVDLLSLEVKDAEDEPAKQINIIETYTAKNPKVMLVSPITGAVTSVLERVKKKGIPIVMLDRKVGDFWDYWIGGDNLEIGQKVGEYLVGRLNGKGTVLLVQGTLGADANIERKAGFMEYIKAYPGITVIEGADCAFQRQQARVYMDWFLQQKKGFDAIYAFNDEMAIGAAMAMEANGLNKRIIVGVDGCQKEVMSFIKDGRIDATFVYPIPGIEGMRLAASLIKGTPPKEHIIKLQTQRIDRSNVEKFVEENSFLVD